MPPSQLKRLKASLREQGITGPQKSKKQKQRAANDKATQDKRVARSAALEGIREQFNPFEVRRAKPGKFAIANAENAAGSIAGRPGVSRSKGEETRRNTLLKEMQRRGKVGGMVDRRFGENDPTMTPEERELQRFIKEQERGRRKASMFNLEDDDEDDFGEEEVGLTHLGRSLGLVGADDFDASGASPSEDGDADAEGALRGQKRRRLSAGEDGQDPEGAGVDAPDRPKTKAEVMKEVIAKSKLHKYERQKAKEDDEDLRAELDEGLQDVFALLRGTSSSKPKPAEKPVEPVMNPDRAALLEGKDRKDADREYDMRLRQLALDPRSKPSERTKTEEELAAERAERLRKLEDQRQRRMRGEPSDDEQGPDELGPDDDVLEDGVAGLGTGLPTQASRRPLAVEDEDEFVLDDDLIGSGSDIEAILDQSSSEEESIDEDEDEDEEAEFVADLTKSMPSKTNGMNRASLSNSAKAASTATNGDNMNAGLAFTYRCPQSHEEFLDVTADVPEKDLITVVQRIRALYHPKLSSTNKELLANFSTALVDHVSYTMNRPTRPDIKVVDSLIRHIHSLAKTFPIEVAQQFRKHLTDMQERAMKPTPGDLILFAAIGSIFPTSDHFHQVVTPAMLTMARYLGQKIPKSLAELAKGLYLCTLGLKYQQLSKRYIPEAVNFLHYTLDALAPKRPEPYGSHPKHESPEGLRIGSGGRFSEETPKSTFWTIEHVPGDEDPEIKSSLLHTALRMVEAASKLWEDKTAFVEIFRPFTMILGHYNRKECLKKLSKTNQDLVKEMKTVLSGKVDAAAKTRPDLELHHHRPLAIKTAIPRFEENFHPDRHYDPDRERSELQKLRAEHKKERKGAMRELRKDASFIARQQLREKIARDEAYEKKQRRLIAEIQGEEGAAANAYEREKRARKGKR